MGRKLWIAAVVLNVVAVGGLSAGGEAGGGGFLAFAGGFLASIVVGVMAAVGWRDQLAFPMQRRLWCAAAATPAVAFVLVAVASAASDDSLDHVIAVLLLLLGCVIGTGAVLLLRGPLPLARTFLLIGGFLGLPLGLFAILAARESRLCDSATSTSTSE